MTSGRRRSARRESSPQALAGRSARAGRLWEIRPGDAIWRPPRGDKHGQGATLTTAMAHVAIQEALDSKAADWPERVTDERCGERPGLERVPAEGRR